MFCNPAPSAGAQRDGEIKMENDSDAAGLHDGATLGRRDIVVSRSGYHLVLRLGDGTHSLTLNDYFRRNAMGGYVRDEVRLVDGGLWTLAQLQARRKLATATATATVP